MVYFTEHDGGVNLATLQLGKGVEGTAAVLIVQTQHGESYQHLVGMEAGIVTVEQDGLGVLDRLYVGLWNQFDAVVDAGQVFGSIEQQCGTGSEKGTGVTGDNGAVGQLDSGCVGTLFLLALASRHSGTTIVGGNLHLLHQQADFVDLVLGYLAFGIVAEGGIVATDDFVLGGLRANFVVANAEAGHIHTHVGGRLVGILAINALEDGVEYGENLDVAIVVDRGLAVGFEMEGVDHIDVVEVGCSSLVGDIDRVLERDAPNGEGLKFGIAGFDTNQVDGLMKGEFKEI